MSNLTKYLKLEEIEVLKEKGEEFLGKFEKQLSNPLYKDANFLYNRTQLNQMVKAAEKYPNPLNVKDWTPEEVLNHAFEELVDQSHYLTTLKYHIDDLKAQIKKYRDDANYWKDKYENLVKEGE